MEKVEYLARRLSSTDIKESKMQQYLLRLKDITMTIAILRETGIGKIVNKIKKSGTSCEHTAKELIADWKELAAQEPNDSAAIINKQSRTSGDKHRSSHTESKHTKTKHSNSHTRSDKYEKSTEVPESSSGKKAEKRRVDEPRESNIFDLALNPTKKPKRDDSRTSKDHHRKDRDLKKTSKHKSKAEAPKHCKAPTQRSIEQEINQMAPKPSEQVKLSVSDILNDDSEDYITRPGPSVSRHDSVATYDVGIKKNSKTMVFSGRKTARHVEMKSLTQLCLDVMTQHIDDIGYLGQVPAHVFMPVLERCSAKQLSNVEYYNPDFVEDTNGLWRAHCEKDFPKEDREHLESWKEMYERCTDTREARLNALTKNIQDKWKKKQAPVKKTRLAYVDEAAKAPRDVRRKQARYGTAGPRSNVSTDRVNRVVEQTPRQYKLPAVDISELALNKPEPKKRKKTAPLMAKALKMAKNWRR